MTVDIAGTHVQEVNPSHPTLETFISGNTIKLGDITRASGSVNLPIVGTGLDGVKQVELANSTDSKIVIAATLQPLAGENSVNPNAALLSIPPTAKAEKGTYTITFILADGTAIKTGQTIVVTQ